MNPDKFYIKPEAVEGFTTVYQIMDHARRHYPTKAAYRQMETRTEESSITFGQFAENTEALRAALPGTNVVVFENMNLGLPFYGGEISDASRNKATAMDLLCERLGCTKDDCIAFGDSMNDAEIIQAAGLGIAMGNAEPGVKAAADLVCESCDEDGVAKALKQLGLI